MHQSVGAVVVGWQLVSGSAVMEGIPGLTTGLVSGDR